MKFSPESAFERPRGSGFNLTGRRPLAAPCRACAGLQLGESGGAAGAATSPRPPPMATATAAASTGAVGPRAGAGPLPPGIMEGDSLRAMPWACVCTCVCKKHMPGRASGVGRRGATPPHAWRDPMVLALSAHAPIVLGSMAGPSGPADNHGLAAFPRSPCLADAALGAGPWGCQSLPITGQLG